MMSSHPPPLFFQHLLLYNVNQRGFPNSAVSVDSVCRALRKIHYNGTPKLKFKIRALRSLVLKHFCNIFEKGCQFFSKYFCLLFVNIEIFTFLTRKSKEMSRSNYNMRVASAEYFKSRLCLQYTFCIRNGEPNNVCSHLIVSGGEVRCI